MPYSASASDTLIALFEREGFARVEPPVLQPADLFIDLSGEDIRRRMFVTQGAAGQELCLRPEYTIPVCRQHLAAAAAGPAAYSYCGPVFRLRANETGEFLQAGVESIGRADSAAADADILAIALEGLEALGVGPVAVRLGDMGLLDLVLDALAVPPAAKRRLIRSVVAGDLPALLGSDDSGAPEHAGLLAAIEGQAPQAARAFVEDVLSIAGISRVGGRSASEIAERFLARAAQPSGALAPEQRAILSRYLAIEGDPDEAAAAIEALAREASLRIDPARAALEDRTGFMAARGLDVATFTFAGRFARNVDYYTGFIFEIRDPKRADDKPMVGGGRYDRLLQHLGADGPVPAVGCSIWLDRLGGDAGGGL